MRAMRMSRTLSTRSKTGKKRIAWTAPTPAVIVAAVRSDRPRSPWVSGGDAAAEASTATRKRPRGDDSERSRVAASTALRTKGGRRWG